LHTLSRFLQQTALKYYFGESYPKVIFWQVIRIFDFLSLSTDSRYLQSEPLNEGLLNRYFSPSFGVNALNFSTAIINRQITQGLNGQQTRGLVFKETGVFRRWGSETKNFGFIK